MRIDPIFLACRWRATHHWKALNEATNLLQTSFQSKVCTTKLWAPKVVGVPTSTISGLPLGSPRTKCHLDVGLMERHKVYYKGEGGGFPQVQAMVNLVSPSSPWLVLAPKVLKLCTNHLVLVLCRFVWVVEACQFFLIPSRSSNTPLYPSKVLWAKERAPIPYSFAVFSLDSHLSPSKSWEHIPQRVLPTMNPNMPPLPPNRPYCWPLNYPKYVKDSDLNVHVRMFKVTIRENSETYDVEIVNLFGFTLRDIVFNWCNNYMGEYPNYTFTKLKLLFL